MTVRHGRTAGWQDGRTTAPSTRPTALTAWIGVVALAALSCGGEQVESEPVIRPVRYAQVFAVGSERLRVFAGTAQAASEQSLSFRVGGILRQVAVDVGTPVRRGQLIASLDPSDYVLEGQQSEATLAQAKAQARNAQASYERTLSLYENNNASRADVDAARAQFESANASVRSADTGLRLSQQQVGYTRLRAPVAGVISRVDVEANEIVSPGAAVVVLDGEGRLEVEVAVPEAFIGRVQSGSSVDVSFDAVPGATFPATVTEVGVATSGAGTFPVVVRLDDDAGDVRSGMAAEVAFSIEAGGSDNGNVVIVPSQAVGQDHQSRFVFVLTRGANDLATAARRDVEVGSLSAEGLEVTNGLADGEYVATAGLRTLADGQQVRLLGIQ